MRNGGLSLSCFVRGTFAGGSTSKADALAMIDDGRAPSALGTEFQAWYAATHQNAVVAGIDLAKLHCWWMHYFDASLVSLLLRR